MKNNISKIFSAVVIILTICFIFEASSIAAKKKSSKKATAPEAPIVYIPVEVTDALQISDIKEAIRNMRMEAHSPRSKYLLQEMQRIVDYQSLKKGRTAKNDRLLYNVGAAYHNLYLFLKNQGIENNDFYKNAENFYLKAMKSRDASRKNHVTITLAALYAAGGDTKKAEKTFEKVDESEIEGHFVKKETLALYYAAIGDTDKALPYIEESYRINADYTKFWLGVSDDFYSLKDNEQFQKLLKDWKVERLDRSSEAKSPEVKHLVH